MGLARRLITSSVRQVPSRRGNLATPISESNREPCETGGKRNDDSEGGGERARVQRQTVRASSKKKVNQIIRAKSRVWTRSCQTGRLTNSRPTSAQVVGQEVDGPGVGSHNLGEKVKTEATQTAKTFSKTLSKLLQLGHRSKDVTLQTAPSRVPATSNHLK